MQLIVLNQWMSSNFQSQWHTDVICCIAAVIVSTSVTAVFVVFAFRMLIARLWGVVYSLYRLAHVLSTIKDYFFIFWRFIIGTIYRDSPTTTG